MLFPDPLKSNKSKLLRYVAQETNLKPIQVEKTVKLLNDGATIPFLARYRKEVTGNLDEVQIGRIRELCETFAALEKRKSFIIKSLMERQLLSKDLQGRINNCFDKTGLEDIYRPFRPPKRTKAVLAKERGLQPLAAELLKQSDKKIDLRSYVSSANEVPDSATALDGARDIISQTISEDATVRQLLRTLFQEHSFITARVVKAKICQADKYRDYFDYSARFKKVPMHRFLALMRGAEEKLLQVSIRPEARKAVAAVKAHYLKGCSFSSRQVGIAIESAYKRLLAPSMENEMIKLVKERADKESIEVFSKNLRELILAPPYGAKNTLAFDPGFQSGAKVVVLDGQGKLLDYCKLFLLTGNRQDEEAEKIRELCRRYQIAVIAVGNGTAGRETEEFLKGLTLNVDVVMVDERGASIYSASEVARREFPDLDLTFRGAVSIGRRLQDPLAELVKVDPKSIGVGQYQHDVDQKQLKKGLDDQVVTCVNSVGVNLNNASSELLAYVAGIGPKLADKIVSFRTARGPFKNRQQLKSVPGLGEKVFEQCAGFLRIYDGHNPLDKSAVHPESYSLVQKICRDLNKSLDDLIGQPLSVDAGKYTEGAFGLETIQDILKELEKPGRDIRSAFKPFSFDRKVRKIGDLQKGMKLPGIVTNVTNFGAFVDIGVHQDGLIHLSKLCKRFIHDPSEVVRVKQQVLVTVVEVDIKRTRIALSMIDE